MDLEQGFRLHPHIIPTELQQQLAVAITEYQALHNTSLIRHANMKLPIIQHFATSPMITKLASRYIVGSIQLVRAIVFDKNSQENWFVTWHQDKTIAVTEQRDVPGWKAWTLKEDVHHVQPDIALLSNCITLRCHLDNTDTTNGCLQVIANTHQRIWSSEQIAKLSTEQNSIACEAEAGDILVMRPLLLHASKKATSPMHRRVIHLEFCGAQLPQGLGFAG